MTDIKYCKRCGTMISDVNNTDWYRHISVKYCPDCRRESDRQKTALRVYNLRQRKKQKDKFRDEQFELLKVENELLRKRVLKLREETESLQ